MTPLKAKSLIPKAAELSGFKEDLARTVIEFFYKDLRRRLSSMQVKKIVIDNFGSFYIKEKVMLSYEKRYLHMQVVISKYIDSPRKEILLRSLSENLENFKRIKAQLQEEREQRQFFILHKQTLNEKQNTGSMEEQVEDTEGNNK